MTVGRWTLQGRLVRSLTIGLTASWLVAVGCAALAVRFELHEVFDSVLQETAQHLLADIMTQRPAALLTPPTGEAPATLPAVPHDEYITYQILTAEGQVRLRSHQAPAEAFLLPIRPGFAWDSAGRRIYTEASVDGLFVIEIAEPAETRYESILWSTLLLLLPLWGLVPVAMWLVRRQVRHGLKPLVALQREVADRSSGNLAPLPLLTLPLELALLVGDVNQLLRRMALALEGERSFTANSAHELRTPVASALAQTQVLAAQLGEDTPAGARALAIAAELQRLGRLAERLLQLSRAEAGGVQAVAEVDLVPLARLLLADMASAPGVAERLCFDPLGQAHFMVHGDLDALGIVLRNLLENALHYGDTGQPIRLRLHADHSLSVANGSAVVPAEVLATLTQRFRRLEASKPGSGLGLAIAETVMRQIGGSLELHSPVRGEAAGFEVVLRFPPQG